MNVDINKTVSYEVKQVKITNLGIRLDTAGKLIITTPYQWLNAANEVVRTGTNRYTEDALIAAFIAAGGSFAPMAAILKAMVPATGKYPGCNISTRDAGTWVATKSYLGTDAEGKDKWVFERLTDEQFAAAIAPMTREQFIAVITQFTLSIFA